MEEPYDPEDVKLLVRVLRALRGWDQMELATAAGMDASSISHYETGRKVPSRRILGRLAVAVGVSASFVESCLLPVLSAARAAATRFTGEALDDPEGAATELGRALAGAGRSTLATFFSRLGSARRRPWERTGPPSPEDRIVAADLWQRLERRSAEERRFLVESCREFQLWSLAERLCHESEALASGEEALELARLALRVAELAPGDEAWRSRLEGYVLISLANAQSVSGDPPAGDETFARACTLWERGAAGDPGLLLGAPASRRLFLL
jgi:transcriptional regulator with XRE-family HTH domain